MDPRKAPKRFIVAGKPVWNVGGVLASTARANQTWAKREKHLKGMIRRLEQALRSREKSLEKAHEYIELLKTERKPITAYQAPNTGQTAMRVPPVKIAKKK